MEKILAVGKVIKMPCMRAGLCKYPNEMVLVTHQALQAMASSFQGIPVVIEHPDFKITDETIGTLPVVGRVADMHYDEYYQEWYAHFVVDDAKAVELLQSGYGISTAWIGETWGNAGTYNNVPYDREVITGKYEHLAIVKTPRYEMAYNPIFMNSKDGQNEPTKDIINNEQKRGVSMIGKLFRKLTQKEEVLVNSNEEYLVEIDGKETLLKDVIESVKANAYDEKKINGDDEIDVDGEKMSLNQLIDSYKELKAASLKKNEDAEEKEEKEENEDTEEKEEKKENSVDPETEKRFKEIDDIHVNGADKDAPVFLSLHERVQMGKNRYGSK